MQKIFCWQVNPSDKRSRENVDRAESFLGGGRFSTAERGGASHAKGCHCDALGINTQAQENVPLQNAHRRNGDFDRVGALLFLCKFTPSMSKQNADFYSSNC